MDKQVGNDIQHAIDNNLKPPQKAFVEAVILKQIEGLDWYEFTF